MSACTYVSFCFVCVCVGTVAVCSACSPDVLSENAAKDFVAEMSAVSTCSHHHVTWMPDSATLLPSVQVRVMGAFDPCIQHCRHTAVYSVAFCIFKDTELTLELISLMVVYWKSLC